MSCLNVDIFKIGEALSLDIAKLGGVEMTASLYGEYISPIISEIGQHLNVSCGIICSISDIFYLEVSPEDVVWITPDEGIIYNVHSNVNWFIE